MFLVYVFLPLVAMLLLAVYWFVESNKPTTNQLRDFSGTH